MAVNRPSWLASPVTVTRTGLSVDEGMMIKLGVDLNDDEENG
jgi:hypothetical protein